MSSEELQNNDYLLGKSAADAKNAHQEKEVRKVKQAQLSADTRTLRFIKFDVDPWSTGVPAEYKEVNPWDQIG